MAVGWCFYGGEVGVQGTCGKVAPPSGCNGRLGERGLGFCPLACSFFPGPSWGWGGVGKFFVSRVDYRVVVVGSSGEGGGNQKGLGPLLKGGGAGTRVVRGCPGGRVKRFINFYPPSGGGRFGWFAGQEKAWELSARISRQCGAKRSRNAYGKTIIQEEHFPGNFGFLGGGFGVLLWRGIRESF